MIDTCRTGTAYSSGIPEFTLIFSPVFYDVGVADLQLFVFIHHDG